MKSSRIITALIAVMIAVPALAQEAAPEVAADLPWRFAEADLNGDGSITEDEIRQARAARVAGMDADGDGFLTAAELVAHHQAEATARIEAMVAAHMARQDLDGDGRLGAAEVMIGGHGRGDDRLMEMFGRADADDDGAVTAEEFASVRDQMRGQMQGRGNRDGRGDRWMQGGDRWMQGGEHKHDGDHERGGRRGHRFYPQPEGDDN